MCSIQNEGDLVLLRKLRTSIYIVMCKDLIAPDINTLRRNFATKHKKVVRKVHPRLSEWDAKNTATEKQPKGQCQLCHCPLAVSPMAHHGWTRMQ